MITETKVLCPQCQNDDVEMTGAGIGASDKNTHQNISIDLRRHDYQTPLKVETSFSSALDHTKMTGCFCFRCRNCGGEWIIGIYADKGKLIMEVSTT